MIMLYFCKIFYGTSNMKKLLLPLLFFAAFPLLHAQTTYLCNEKFSSKKPSGWDIIPTYSATAPSWKPDTGICVSTKYAMHCQLPINAGDTATLVTPFFDCTNYKYIQLRFNHICKVLPSDICRIEYQEDVLGTAHKWRPIPYDAYKGGCATYRKDTGFNHSSYKIWADYDTLAKPTNGWWQSETFDMSDYAGYSKVRFRFIIRKGNNPGSYIAAGWYVDDFQVAGSNVPIHDTDSKSVALASIDSPDECTVAGPQPVKVTIRNTGKGWLKSCQLNWTVNGILQQTMSWKGQLFTDSCDTFTLGRYTQKQMGCDTITVWVKNPNNLPDSILNDDTLTVITYSNDSLLKGTYTVGKSEQYDFHSLTDVLNIIKTMKCGMGGDVTLKLASGIYSEKLIFNGFNTTGKHHLTICSIAGSADSVIFQPASGPVVSLNKCAGLTFKNITFNAQKLRDNCILLDTGLNNIEFNHCKMTGFDTTYNIWYFPPAIYATICRNHKAPIHDIRFIGNEIMGGTYGIYFCGDYSISRNSHILLDSNRIADYDYNAVYLSCNNNVKITHNRFEGARTGNDDEYSLYCEETANCLIDANRFTSGNSICNQTAIYTHKTDSATIISNNEIILNNPTNGTVQGLLMEELLGTKILNNSILIYGKGTSYGIYTSMYYFSNSAIIRNNIVACVGTGTNYPFYTSSIRAATNYDMDYNCLYSKEMMAYENGEVTSEKEHMANFPSAVHDIYRRPIFCDNTKSLTLKASWNMECPRAAGADRDINGELRPTLTSMGAYISRPTPVNGVLSGILDVPGKTDAADTLRPHLILTNGGTDTITEATIRMEINGVSVGREIQWNGKLGLKQSDTIAMGDFLLNGGDNTLTAYIGKLDNMKDTITEDDTISISTYTCAQPFAGTYTVGKGGQFSSIKKFIEKMALCGMGGPVVLEIASGQYKGIQLEDFHLGSDSNTLTLRSAAMNRDSVIFKDFLALDLTESSHLRFEEISFYGSIYAIEMGGMIEDVEFRHCNISADTDPNYQNYAVYYHNSNGGKKYPKDLRFIGNNIQGGYFNMSFYYTAGTTANMMNCSITIDSNILSGAHSTAIYAYFYNNFKSISHNTITNGSTASGFYGIYMHEYCLANRIEGNRIYLNNTSTGYGMYLYNFKSFDVTSTGTIANNEIILTGNGEKYGIYQRQNAMYNIVNNSIYVKGSSTCYALYCQNDNSKYQVNILNNNLVNDYTSGYGLYNAHPASYASTYGVRDYNNYYSKSNNHAYLNGATQTTLAAIQSVSTDQDQHSIVVNPTWANADTLGPKNLEILGSNHFSCKTAYNVSRDILGLPRSATTCMGCYGLEPDSNDAQLIGFTNLDSITSTGTHPVRVILHNAGINPIDSATISLTVKGVTLPSVAYRPSLPLLQTQSDTITLANISFQHGSLNMQAVVRMKGDTNSSNDTAFANQIVSCSKSFAGVITIGNSMSADYTLADLEKIMLEMAHCGVSGDITWQIEDGNYTTSTIDLSPLDSIMNGHWLTIASQSGDSSKVIVTCGSNNLLVLGGNKNVVIRNLTLASLTGDVIYFKSNCDSIDILHNHLIAPMTGNYFLTSNTIKSYHNIINGLRIIGNQIEGGNYGILLYANEVMHSTAYLNKDVVIDSNYIFGQHATAIDLQNNYLISLSHNKLRPNTRECIRSRYDNALVIDGNDIDASGNNDPCPIILSYLNYHNVTNQAMVSNNVIKCPNTKNSKGIYLYYSRINFCHNSILMSDTGKGSAVYCEMEDTKRMINIYGNLLITNAQYPIYWHSTVHGNMDYNNYYSNRGYIGYFGSSGISTMGAWRTATGGDTHSVSLPVDFLNISKNMKLRDYSSFLMPSLAGVHTDFEGMTRNKITAMGAYNQTVIKFDAALTDFAKTNLNTQSKAHIEVTLANYGKDTLTSATLEWTVNGVAQPAVKWKGILTQFNTTAVTLGDIALPTGKIANITAWVTAPNGIKDMEASNDTVFMSEMVCNNNMAGIYTVGGKSPDFDSFEEAVRALDRCGVSAPVTLKLCHSITKGLLISGQVKGTSDTVAITVIPDSSANVSIGCPDGVALYLSNASHWHFRGLTIGDTNNGMVGVKLIGNLNDIHFLHCNIYSSTTTTSSSFRAVEYPNSGSNAYPVDLVFVGNNIRGGYYNMFLHYPAGSTDNMTVSSITIDSNILSDACSYGIYSYYQSHYKSISYNSVTNRKGSDNNYYGIYNNNYSNVDRMESNHININSSGTAYGIYWSYYMNCASYGGKPGVIKNNEVILSGGGKSTKYGIYFYLPIQNWEIVHNSIFVDGDNGTAYGLYCRNSSSTYKETIKNNLIVTKGTGTNYPIHLDSYYSNSYVILDYNNYKNLSNNNIGYAGTNINSLSSWQLTTGMDAHSVSVRPKFTDSTASLEPNEHIPFICPRLASASTDINGDRRTAITTMGAYGFEFYEDVNLHVVEFVSPQPIADVICYADYTTVRIAVRNTGIKDADFTKSPLNVSLDITGATSCHFDTIITKGCIKFQQTDTIVLTSVPTFSNGIYNMKVTISNSDDTLPEDDTLSLIYNASRVELPYDIDFSTEPDEFVNVTMFGNTGWEVVKGTGSNPTISPVFGTGRLEFAGANNPGSNANAIFNAVNIQNCINPMLSFWYAHSANCTGNDMLIVMATTDGGANYTELKRIKVADTATAWKQYDIDLNAFTKSSCLSIVFRAMSYGGANQSIDRIRITAEKDASFELLPIDLTQRTACDNTPVDVKAVITNLSRLNIDMSNDTLTLNVTGAVNYSNKIIYNHRLGDFESDTVTLGQISLDANGAYYFEAFMQSFDNRNSNDTVTDSTLFIWQDITLDTLFGLDGQMFKKTGDTVHVSTLAVNNGNIPVEMVLLRLSIDGKEVVTDTIRKHLNAGDTVRHTMSKCYTVPAVSKDQPYYFFELKTELACDADNTNNAISIVGQVDIPDSIDIQVLEVATTAQALGKTKLAPSVRVANIGNMAVENVLLHVDVVNDSNRVVESISENISHMAVNETKNHQFTMTYKVPNYTGQYTLRAYVEAFDGDNIRSNDTIARQFRCYRDSVGIREITDLDWQLGQNIPNPATEITAIPFTLPQEGTVRLSVMTANGQVIHRQEIQGEAGGNRLELNTADWTSGIYYYTMEYRGQRITKKLTVTR